MDSPGRYAVGLHGSDDPMNIHGELNREEPKAIGTAWSHRQCACGAHANRRSGCASASRTCFTRNADGFARCSTVHLLSSAGGIDSMRIHGICFDESQSNDFGALIPSFVPNEQRVRLEMSEVWQVLCEIS